MLFFLTLDEIKDQILAASPLPATELQGRIANRQQRFQQDQQMDIIPYLVFGNEPPNHDQVLATHSPDDIKQRFSGIAASAGVVEGPVRVMTQLESLDGQEGPFILVVPYTDAGWAPLLARAQG